MTILQKLKERFPGVREGEPLKNHGTFRVGGPADFFYELMNIEELPELVTLAEENSVPYRIIGRGTNILFTDKGFRGLIIKNISKELAIRENGEIVADSGVLLAQMIRFSIEQNYTGLEPLYGLPGSIGGALWGNAGVPGTEVSAFARTVTLFNAADGIREVTKEDIEFRYRWSSLQTGKDLILRAAFELPKGDAQKSKETMKTIDAIRRGKQPTGYTAGSFFKNPTADKSAGYLIDQAGLKGFTLGNAQISEKHANFFMNRGGATFAQILELAQLAQQKVKAKFGIDLEMEVKIIGEMTLT